MHLLFVYFNADAQANPTIISKTVNSEQQRPPGLSNAQSHLDCVTGEQNSAAVAEMAQSPQVLVGRCRVP